MRKAYNGEYLSNFRKKVYKKTWLDGDKDVELSYLEAMSWIRDWKEGEKPIWWES